MLMVRVQAIDWAYLEQCTVVLETAVLVSRPLEASSAWSWSCLGLEPSGLGLGLGLEPSGLGLGLETSGLGLEQVLAVLINCLLLTVKSID